jgi:hypothetical protein
MLGHPERRVLLSFGLLGISIYQGQRAKRNDSCKCNYSSL